MCCNCRMMVVDDADRGTVSSRMAKWMHLRRGIAAAAAAAGRRGDSRDSGTGP